MKKTTLKSLALILALSFVFTLSGCSEAGNSAGPVTVTDMMGRSVSLEGPAERIVALTAADCEILFALGAGDTLVGRGEFCDYPDEALDAPVVQSGYETNLEQIIALEPQVVLMSTMNQSKEQVEALEDAGIAVVVSNATKIEEVYTAIELIGEITAKDDEADVLVSEIKAAFSQYDTIPDSGKTVYFEVSPLQYGLWTAGSGTFMDELATMLGLTNIFADVQGWAEISEEQVIERNPDYIVTITMYYGEGPKPEDEIASRAGWQDITAVKNGDVFNADNDEISRPGPRLTEAAESLYHFFYRD